MSGRLGMELQPKQLNEEEKTFARQAIINYKGIRDLVMFGDLYRIVSPYEGQGYYSLMYVGKDKKRAVVYGYSISYRSFKDFNEGLYYLEEGVVQLLAATHTGQEGAYIDFESKALHAGMLDLLGMEICDMLQIVAYNMPRGAADAPIIEIF